MQATSETVGTPYDGLSPERNLFDGDSGRIRRRTTPIARVQNIPPRPDQPSEANLERKKVNNSRLSELAKWILRNAGDGIERGEIVAGFYEVERLYIGYYLDPCFRSKERREHDRQNRYVQPRVTMALKRLKRRGLVQLIRQGKYVKEIRLTEMGKAVAEELKKATNMNGDSQ